MQTRRSVLAAGAALAAMAAARGAAAQSSAPIAQPPDATAHAFMRRALDLAGQASQAGDQDFGAVVVRDGRIVGQAPSRVVTNVDPTAHAEIEALRDAARRLGTRDLSGAILYSSFRPCPMCEAAASWAGIARLVHSAAITDEGPPRLRRC